MASAHNDMLPPFHIRNLHSPLDIVRVSVPGYEESLSSNPRAALRYDDDDGDLITVGSSFELEQQLEGKPSAIQRRQLADLYKSRKTSSDPECLHVFSIDSGERVQKLWYELQESTRTESQQPQGDSSTSRDWSAVHKPSLEKLSCEGTTIKNDISDAFENCLPMSAKPLGKQFSWREVLHTPTTSSPRAATFENHRVHYFNTTNPPQLHWTEKHTNVTNGQTVRAENRTGADVPTRIEAPDAAKVQGGRAKVDTKHGVLAANLTHEGKRQAQLAGEKFRARGLYTRPRKMSTGQTDRSSYHNRWESYKSNENPKSFLSSLTPESKRQAQNVGDRLRSRTSRIRHGVKGLSDQAGTAEADWKFGTVSDLNATTPNKAEETGKVSSNHQKSLLEVFESELAKHPKDSACQTESPFVPFCRPSAPLKPIFTEQMKPLASTSHLPSPQPTSTAIEDGIKNALSGFEACLRGIISTLKAVEPSRSDNEILGETMNAFRDLAQKLSPQHVVSFDANLDTTTLQVNPKDGLVSEDAEKIEPQPSVMTANTPKIPEDWKPHGAKMKQNNLDFLPPFPSQTSNIRTKSEAPHFDKRKSEFMSDFAGPFQYHRPGPIHLPQPGLTEENLPLTQLGGATPKRSGYVDHLRRFNSVDIPRNPLTTPQQQDSTPSDHVNQDRFASPTAVTTRFPTISQFEDATFSNNFAAPAPPSLIDFDPEISQKLSPATKIGTTLNETESSGQIFNRMTAARIGKGTAPLALQNERFPSRSSRMSDTFGADRARLLRPFDAFAAEAALQSQRKGVVHRSATVAAPSLRRPHSEIFSGNSLFAWDPLTSQQRKQWSNQTPGAEISSTSLPLPAPSMTPSRPLPWVRPPETSGMRRSATDAGARREPNLRPRDIKVRKCVDSLTGLGFDMERSRLRVYASVADGDLDEAIDMLTEDQKVHESRK